MSIEVRYTSHERADTNLSAFRNAFHSMKGLPHPKRVTPYDPDHPFCLIYLGAPQQHLSSGIVGYFRDAVEIEAFLEARWSSLKTGLQ